MAEDESKDPTFGLLPEDDDVLTQHRCVGCGVLSPPTRTAYTLIGKAHGWRVTRYPAPPRPGVDRAWRFEWRCPSCWAAQRAGDAPTSSRAADGPPGDAAASDSPPDEAPPQGAPPQGTPPGDG